MLLVHKTTSSFFQDFVIGQFWDENVTDLYLVTIGSYIVRLSILQDPRYFCSHVILVVYPSVHHRK